MLHYFVPWHVHRLHREALKQSATDPLSGKIDVGILTTGLSSAARKRRQELTDGLRKLLTTKGKGSSLNFQKMLAEIKETFQTVRILRFIQSKFSYIIFVESQKGNNL